MMTMEFNAEPIISDLKRNKDIIYSLLHKINEEEYLWKQDESKWSLIEVVCHLLDEEREDFRARVKSVLENPDNNLLPIDPVGWVKSRKYQDQDFNEKIQAWKAEREKSIVWLENLGEQPWHNAYQHPKFGPMSAKLFLCNWLSHDYHHIRQIITIKRAYIMHTTGENLRYAGTW